VSPRAIFQASIGDQRQKPLGAAKPSDCPAQGLGESFVVRKLLS
jgi:hypothetical protein